VADVGEEFGLGPVGRFGAVFFVGVLLGELDHLLRLLFELLARLAEIGDGRHQPALAVDQPALVALQLGDVGADRNEAAVLGAALVNLQPARILQLQFERTGAGFRHALVDDLRANQRLAAGRDHIGIRSPGRRRLIRDAMQLLVLRIAHHQTVVGVP
jgi:hypothetical protein